jgi:hypothetical protein
VLRGDAAWPASGAAIRHYDLAVLGAREQWRQIRWSLFVFPDITDVAPTNDPDVVRIFFEGRRAYPNVWTIQLLQAGFDVPAPGTPRATNASSAPARLPRCA